MARKEFTDSEFIDGLKSGDDTVLQALYKRHFPPVLRYILANNGSDAEAKDIYQETFIVLYNNARKENFVLSCALQTYIYSIARRMWLKQLTRGNNTTRLNDDTFGVSFDPADVYQEVEEYQQKEQDLSKMTIHLEQLGEPCKSLIEDFYIKQLSMDQLAEKFGYTNADNAKNQKYKCLQRLKKLFFES